MSSVKYIENKQNNDWSNDLVRYVAEIYLTLPIAVLGIVGNIVSFVVLCHQRRHKLQIITLLLQVYHHHRHHHVVY